MLLFWISSSYRNTLVTLTPFSDEEAEQSGRGAEPESRRSRTFPEDDLEEDSEFISGQDSVLYFKIKRTSGKPRVSAGD